MLNLFKSMSVGRLALALVVALFMWGYIQITQFPESSGTFQGVYLSIKNLPDGYILRHASQIPQTIKVSASGPADAIQRLSSNSINAILDFKDHTDFTGDLKVSFDKPPDGVKFVADPETVAVQVEQKITKTLPVTYISKGSPASYSTVGEPTLNPTKVTIVGPKSVVDFAAKASVSVDISNYTGNVVLQSPVSISDINNQAITDTDLQVSPTNISVTLPVSSQFNSKPVPIEVVTQGSPASGFVPVSIKTDPTYVTITGLPSDINQVNTIKTTPVDINNASDVVTATTTLILPERVITNNSSTVEVTLTFSTMGAQRLVVVPLEFKNMPSGFSVSPTEIPISVTLAGPVQMLGQVQISAVHASVDLSGKSEGQLVNLPVQVEVPPDIQPKADPATVSLTLLAIPTAKPRPLPTFTPQPPTVVILPPAPTNTPTSNAKSSPSISPPTPSPSSTPPSAPTGVTITAALTTSAGPSPKQDTPIATLTPIATTTDPNLATPTDIATSTPTSSSKSTLPQVTPRPTALPTTTTRAIEPITLPTLAP
jgi:YbbR domain-containing protein